MLDKALRKYRAKGNYPWWYSKTGLWWAHWRYYWLKQLLPCLWYGHDKMDGLQWPDTTFCTQCSGRWRKDNGTRL